MKAHEIIDRLAALDEQAPVEEPQVEPDAEPMEPPAEPGEPTPRRTPKRDPFTLPPDFEPGTMPRPKAAQEDTDDMAAIQSWLEATEQPIQDWEWDGNELRLLMNDGNTEVYTRSQLEDTGVFSTEMAMAESVDAEDEDGGMGPLGPDAEEVVVDGPPADVEEFAAEAPHDEAAGVLDQLLGRAPSTTAPELEPGETGEPGEDEVIHVEGEEAEELTTAVSDMVNAILGIVQKAAGEEAPETTPDSASDSAPKKEKKEAKKSDKSKDDKEKDDDKKDDEKHAKKDDE